MYKFSQLATRKLRNLVYSKKYEDEVDLTKSNKLACIRKFIYIIQTPRFFSICSVLDS
jgi:hypothetical protein